ncbi:MAG: hypothetical protein MK171_07520 [Pirellulales bacterium]|nr:hypothetical protein [Pirellulales bacterium]
MFDPSISMRHAQLGVFLASCFALAGGCDDGRPDRIQVSGRVTFGGGTCPADGRLIFAAKEAAPGFPMRPGYATFDTDGNYRATTWTEGDGLMPGKYLVAVECWKVKPAFKVAGESYISGQYMHPRTSGIELEVSPDFDKIDKDFDFPQLP